MPMKYQDEARVEAYRRLCRVMGRRVAEVRRDLGWTQARLSEAIGRQVSLLGQIETGRQGINLMDLLRISHVTGYPLSYFVDQDEPKSEAPVTLYEWNRLYPDEPDRARAHWQLDAAIASAREQPEAVRA